MTPGPAFCSCCEPDAPLPPGTLVNRPGLDAITWASGGYATARAAMLEAIARGPRHPLFPDDPRWPAETRAALAALTNRDDADYAVMLIDLFAAVADVLGFYAERIANEMFLSTARERDSLLRLAGLIGYRASPGSAATTMLAFTLDAGASVRVPAALKVMSVPAQDEAPQTFETLAEIAALAALNDVPAHGAPIDVLPFDGGSRLPIFSRPTSLARGDALILTDGERLERRRVAAIEQAIDGEELELDRAPETGGAGAVGFKLRRELALFGRDAPPTWSKYDSAQPPALRWIIVNAGASGYPIDLEANRPSYALDRIVADLAEGALLLVDLGSGVVSPAKRYMFARVEQVGQAHETLGALAATVTTVRLARLAVVLPGHQMNVVLGQSLPAIADLRATRIYELDPAPVAPRPYRYPAGLSGSTLYIRSDQLADASAIVKGRWLMIAAGDRRHLARTTDVGALPAGADGVAHAAIGFTPPIGQPMIAPRLNANLAPASHGETQPDEMLGHGDASRPFQAFRLQRSGLTHLPAAPAPCASIEVRVDGERWAEAPSLFGQRPDARVFTQATGDDGVTRLRFGDGVTGARLPSGAGNVMARYRTGSGRAGRLAADQLTTLLARPVGLRAVANPWPTDGGQDPETVDDARRRAPASVRTFGRAVSLADFADVARETGLVARAAADWAWTGLERAVQLTVAGAAGARLSPEALSRLAEAIDAVRDPNVPLILSQLVRLPIAVGARLLRHPDFERDIVEAGAREALAGLLAFETTAIGKSVHMSQVSAALQGARGVAAVDIDLFNISGAAGWSPAQRALRGLIAGPVQSVIRIFGARPRTASQDPVVLATLALDPDAPALPAEQASVASSDISLTVVEAL